MCSKRTIWYSRILRTAGASIRDGDIRTITQFITGASGGTQTWHLLTLTNYRGMFQEHVTLDLSWLTAKFDENRYSVDPSPAIVGGTYYDAQHAVGRAHRWQP